MCGCQGIGGSTIQQMPAMKAGGAQAAQTVPAAAGHDHAHGGSSDPAQGAKLIGQTVGAWGSTATFQATESMMKDHHGKHEMHTTYVRTSPNDMALANRVMQAGMKLLAPLTWAQTTGKESPNSDHRLIPESVKAQWKAEFPDLPVPNLVVFDKKTQRAVGGMFVGGEKAKDLGMGTLHAHSAGGAVMQHMWFTPSNMELAFSDTTRKAEAIAQAAAR